MENQLVKARENVYPGWWPILEKYIPQILAIDPEAEIEVKEKFGTLRIWVGSETVEDCSVFAPFVEAAEEASKTVCEICGAPGQPRKQRWTQTLCDRCVKLKPNERYQLEQALANQSVPKILFNRARCRKCGSFLESKSVHDLQRCSCGAIAIDGGLRYLRRLGEPADLEELSKIMRPSLSEVIVDATP